MSNTVVKQEELGSRIKMLSEQVINKIAAGEVIERPAAVVRELVDNAIDAGATQIQIEVAEGGRDLIRVSDDACGMSKGDALLAFERHCTSKITSFEDLDNLNSLGFRGEALSSINAVSDLTLRTRAQDASVGHELRFFAGKLNGVVACARAVGSDFEVRNLFYNVPARRKFLRQPATELLKIKNWVLHSSLAHPTVRYRLIADGKELVNLPSAKDLFERAEKILKQANIKFSLQYRAVNVSGLLAHPTLARGTSDTFILLVNSRLVSDRMLLRAAREGFDNMLKPNEYPYGVIDIKIAPDLVDVNVHPQKSEVRFRDSKLVFVALKESISNALKSYTSAFLADSSSQPHFSALKTFNHNISSHSYDAQSSAKVLEPASNSSNFQRFQSTPLSYRGALYTEPQLERQEIKFSELSYIGQALECYLFCQHQGSLYVVDMHAAHERYNFNLIRNGFRSRSIPTQRLLVPITFELSESELLILLEQQAELEAFGFEIERFGSTSLALRTVPTIFSHSAVKTLILEFVSELKSCQAALSERVDAVAARLACHGSIRAGRLLEREEVYALFSALDSSEFSLACPHGRPILIRFSKNQIEHWFGRDR